MANDRDNAAGSKAGDAGASRGLHPAVEAYCRSKNSLLSILTGSPCRDDAMVKAMILALKAMKAGAYREGLRVVQALPLDGADPDLAILFLAVWMLLSEQLGRTQEMRSLVKLAMSLKSKSTPPEVWAELRICEMRTVAVAGNKKGALRIVREVIESLPADSPARDRGLLEQAALLANMGRAGEDAAELARLADQRGNGPQAVRMIRCTQAFESGHAETASKLLAAIEADPSVAAMYRDYLASTRSLVTLMLDERLPADRPAPTAAAVERLLSRRPGEALALVRGEDALLESYHVDSGFPAFNLIRAELACRHAEAARRLMRIRRDIGNEHPMDELFLCRIELLSGDREAAARHFSAAWANARLHGCEPRLDFELRLSCELAPSDLVWLARASDGAPSGTSRERVGRPTPAKPPQGLARLLGNSQAMEEVRRAVLKYAALATPVLIGGETGTGKEEAARALHECGPRAAEPFIAVNCGAIAENLLESELFGHERGAFTGAESARKGIFEEAGRGTVLLDEVGEIPPRLQVALLRVLESGEIRPVGSNRTRRVGCRILAATNADLDALVADGGFRPDLLFRIRRLELSIPPLRERPEDVIALAHHFLGEGRSDGRIPTLSVELQGELLGRSWPGNVRELRNEMERMRLFGSDKLAYEAGDLRPPSRGAADRTGPGAAPGTTPNTGDAPRRTVATSGAHPDVTEARMNAALAASRSPLRRWERLRAAFRRSPELTRQEVMKIMGVSHVTATRDLARLCGEGFIERVKPNASPRTHYFRLRG